MRTAFMWVVLVGCGGVGSSDLDGGGDANNPGDSGQDVVVVNCDGGLVSCGGKCVDTQSDPANCGGCGVVCNTMCTAGVCPLIGNTCDAGTQQVGDNACIAIDATNVYWATGFAMNGSVWKLPLGGGCPTLMVGGQAAPHGMASDGTTLFFADQGAGGSATGGSIQSIPVGGMTATPVAMGQSFPLDVAVDASNVYWTNNGDGSVWKSSKTTPMPIKLAGPAGQNHAGYLRVDSTYVYFTDPAGGVVNKVPIATGSVSALTTPVSFPGHIAIDSMNAYFSSRGNTSAAMMSIPLTASAGTPSQLIPSLPSLNGIATDGTSLWFAEATNVQPYTANTGEIHRTTVAGTSNATLASKQNGPNCVSVDSTSVYWINAGGGMISKTGK